MIIRAKDFLSWKDLEFKVNRGVTLIKGFNHDDGTPEGSGKSAILNSLCWGLFGCMPKDANTDEVIREGASSCSVEIENAEVIIHRARKPNDLHIKYKKTGKIHRGKDARETQKDIERYIGMTFETFCQSIYFAQNYQNKFVTANQEKKGQILSEIENLEQFDRARKVAADEIKLIKEDVLVKTKDVERYTAQTSAAIQSVKSFEELIENFGKEKSIKIQKMFAEIKSLEAEVESYVEEFEEDKTKEVKRLGKDIADLEQQNVHLETQLKEDEELLENAGIDNLEKEMEYNSAVIENHNQLKVELKVKLSSIEKVFKDHEDRKKLLKENQAELKKTVQTLQQIIEEIEDREHDVKHYKAELIKAEEAAAFPDKSNCPTCGQAWDGDISHYEKELKKAERNYKTAAQVLESHKRGIKEYTERADSLKSNIESISSIIESFEAPSSSKLEEALAELEEEQAEFKARNKEIEAEFKKLKMKQLSIQQAADTIKLNLGRIDRLEAQKAEIRKKTPEKELERYKKRYDGLVAEVERLDAEEPTTLQAKWDEAERSLVKLKTELKKAQAAKEESERILIRLETLREGFRELKAYAFQNVLTQLTRKANAYLAELFEQQVKIKFQSVDMKIETTVMIDGKERSLGLYSGGQFRRIALAVDLALADITLARKSNKVNLIILDEYCKDLSEVSMEKVLKLLQSRKCPTILIEHNSIFNSIVNNVFEVELKDKVSRRVG